MAELTSTALPNVEEVIPHRGTMRLIDELTAEGADSLSAAVTIAADHPFHVKGHGVPTYVALEMMAQTICAKDGLDQLRAGKPPSIGFLLGCQRFHTYREWLATGERVTAHVTCKLDAGEMGSFDCTLHDSADTLLARGSISVFRPRDVEKFLKESEANL